MDYYTTIVDRCLKVGMGVAGGGGVGGGVIHKQEINPARREQKSLSWDKLWKAPSWNGETVHKLIIWLVFCWQIERTL